MTLDGLCNWRQVRSGALLLACGLALAPACDGGDDSTSDSDAGSETASGSTDASDGSDGSESATTSSTGAGPTTTGGETTGAMTTGTQSEFALTIWADIFSTNCSCHEGGTGGLSMPSAAAAYENLVGASSTQVPGMNRVQPGDSANSYLLHKLEGTHLDVGGSGDLMPKGATLTGNQIIAVREWIENGAM